MNIPKKAKCLEEYEKYLVLKTRKSQILCLQ